MIKLIQYIHRPNNTELGKGNTHETYLLIKSDFVSALSKMFPPSEEVSAYDVQGKKSYALKSAAGREFRVNQLGQFYRDNDVCAGDEVVLNYIEGDNPQLFIEARTYNRIMLVKNNQGTEIINLERLNEYSSGENQYVIDTIFGQETCSLVISYAGRKQKRQDSPSLTDFYSVTINGTAIQNGTYLLSLGEKPELLFFEKSEIHDVLIDENLVDFTHNTRSKSDVFNGIRLNVKSDYPLQQIFYGAPGTGKSNTIKREVEDKGKTHFRTTFHPDSDYSTFVGCYKPSVKPTGVTLASGEKEEIVTYKFVPQAFTNAYVAAWLSDKEVYLIIEEINRGNCAQIFGDLFQLLDRKGGMSEYPIDADTDLGRYINDKLKQSKRTDIPEEVKSGKKLMLPKNLYIWATMNTSDQSLFPIDSAFKRRWEWCYKPIMEHKDKAYKIEVGKAQYDWWAFVDAINSVIDTVTNSEDKKLGYFFAIPEDDKVITAGQLVGKVLFYLWNDVFKNYGFDDAIFKKPKKEGDRRDRFTFSDFYDGEGPNIENVQTFMSNLGIKDENHTSEQTESTPADE